MRNFSEFVQTASLSETPQYMLTIPMALVCIYLIKKGLKVFGASTALIFHIVITTIIGTLLFTLKEMNIENIKPFFRNDITTIFSGAFSMLAFPFLEVVLFTTILPAVQTKCKASKIYLFSLFIGGGILLAGVVRNILVLGFPTLDAYYFPSYHVLALVNIGDFITRVEVLVAGNFIFSGIIKTAVCLYATSKGLEKLFNLKDHKTLLVPIGFLMVAFSGVYYENTMEMFEFIDIYKYYAPIIQAILPIIILIFAEIKVRRKKKELPQKNMAL